MDTIGMCLEKGYQMNKREMYDTLVAEVEADLTLVQAVVPENYEDYVHTDTREIRVDRGVILKSATSAFADYAVRDGVMVRATKDPEFALVLVAKIGNYIKNKDSATDFTQDDVEAMACASHVSAMWEQESTNFFNHTIEHLIKINKELHAPALLTITKKIIQRPDSLPMLRKMMVEDIEAKVMATLNEDN